MRPIFPDLVSHGPDGYLTLNYAGLTPYLVKALQELLQKFNDLANTVAGFADKFSTKELTFDRATGTDLTLSHQLCIGQTCINEAELKAMIAAAAASGAGGGLPAGNASASSSAILVVNGNNPAQWQLNKAWQDHLGALFTHGGQSETIYATSSVDITQSGTSTLDYWAVVPSTQA